uniref:Kinesin-like protein n=1 Tax=Gadus morhua TaxID=8049 RepID=A0A8C4Z481_GADMO
VTVFRIMKVFVRSRPTATFAQELIEILPDGKTVQIHQSKGRRCGGYHAPSSWCFQLDGVLHLLSQEEVYARVGQEVVLGALDGYNGTVLCFGQTGAGKTYTMTGTTESYRQRGIIPRAVEQVFQEVAKRSDHIFSVQLSYLEVYNDTLTDLLSTLAGPQHLAPREPGGRVSIRGLSLHPVQSQEEALDLLFEGELNRIMGAHAMNNHSSRSHCIFTLHIQSRSRSLSGTTFLRSKLSLVDLAGSERLGRTGGAGQTLREATHINKSLSFLEQTILALADPRRDHIPFRQSKLTHALKHSLGGNCNTVLVANIYGEETQMDETVLSTLPSRMFLRCKSCYLKCVNELQVNGGGARYQPLSEAQQAELQDQVQRPALSLSPLSHVTESPALSLSALNPCPLKSQPCSTPLPSACSSPPTKAQAFEEFKASGGAGLHRLLRSNKEVLQERRALLHLLGQELNAAKRDIDAAAEDVQRRGGDSAGRLRGSEETQDVEEALVGRLGALRTRYRQHHDQLGPARAEVRYCQHLVDRCRVRLLSEFESWYPNSLLSPREVPEGGSITPGLVPPDRSPSLVSLLHGLPWGGGCGWSGTHPGDWGLVETGARFLHHRQRRSMVVCRSERAVAVISVDSETARCLDVGLIK